MPRNRLSQSDRDEWKELIRLSSEHHAQFIEPTRVFAEMYANPNAHWHEEGNPGEGGWPYDRITINFVYADAKTILPQILMRHPKVTVSPGRFLTRLSDRLGRRDPEALRRRQVASLVIEQLTNWRIREFDFRTQMRRAALEDFIRGISIIRHGFIADGGQTDQPEGGENVERVVRDRTIEFEHHQHLRPGWPYAVHWPLDFVRFDPLAISTDEMQWIGFQKFWQLDDLKSQSRFSLPSDFSATHIADVSRRDVTERLTKTKEEHLGRVLVTEIWDRRTKRVIHWVEDWGREIGVEDWPIDFEGLPATVHSSSPQINGIRPIAETSEVLELQQEINKLVSLLLQYAKRGLPAIGVQKDAMEEEEKDKIVRAEVGEVLETLGAPQQVIQQLNLQPIPVTLLQSLNVLEQMRRQVVGLSQISRGIRENVESGTEAAGIIAGANIRVQDRATILRETFERVIRKDYQTLQQVISEDQFLDVVIGDTSLILEVPLEFIQMEYEFRIEVGSTEPTTEESRQRLALGLLQAVTSVPEMARQFNPDALSTFLVESFGLNPLALKASPEASRQQLVVDRLREFATGANGPNGRGVGAALDALKTVDQGEFSQ